MHLIAFQVNSYVREDPFKSKLRLYLGDEDSHQQHLHNFRVFREYGNNDNVEKYLVFAFASAELNPTVKMYDILMREYLKKEFGVEPVNLGSA